VLSSNETVVFRDEIELEGPLTTKVVPVGAGLSAEALMKPANQTTVCMCCLSMHQQGQNIYLDLALQIKPMQTPT